MRGNDPADFVLSTGATCNLSRTITHVLQSAFAFRHGLAKSISISTDAHIVKGPKYEK